MQCSGTCSLLEVSFQFYSPVEPDKQAPGYRNHVIKGHPCVDLLYPQALARQRRVQGQGVPADLNISAGEHKDKSHLPAFVRQQESVMTVHMHWC